MKDGLTILWCSDNRDTAINMLQMYAINSRLQNWWEEVRVIIWGASAKLAAQDTDIQDGIKAMVDVGIKVQACKKCAENFAVIYKLEELGVEVKYIGKEFTDILKNENRVITI